MDFFEHQDQARRNSRKLIFLFALALVGVVLSVYVLLAFAVAGYQVQSERRTPFDPVATLTNWQIMLFVGGATLLTVGGVLHRR